MRQANIECGMRVVGPTGKVAGTVRSYDGIMALDLGRGGFRRHSPTNLKATVEWDNGTTTDHLISSLTKMGD